MAKMTGEKKAITERLENARRACKQLKGYDFSGDEIAKFQRETYPNLGFFCYTLKELVGQLMEGFEMLDDGRKKRKGGDA